MGSTSSGIGGRADLFGASVGSAFSMFEQAHTPNTPMKARKSGTKISRMIRLEANYEN